MRFKTTKLLLSLLLLIGVAYAASDIDWQVIFSGGRKAFSPNFVLRGTGGQTAVGSSTSPNFGLKHGYWQDFGEWQPPSSVMEVRDTTGDPGGSVTVEIVGSWSDTIQAYQIGITYDNTKLDFINVDYTGTIAETYGADYQLGDEMSPGVLSLGVMWFPPLNECPPPGSGVLAKLVFDIITEEETSTDLILQSLSVYTGTDGMNRYAVLISGTVTIGGEAYVCGDADGNGIVNISDAVYLITYIFGGGDPPDPLLSGDCDCNAIVNISDAVYLITYIFGGGPEPCAACPKGFAPKSPPGGRGSVSQRSAAGDSGVYPRMCGDANDDGMVNISDAVYICNYVMVFGFPAPNPLCFADASGDGFVNASDFVYILNFLFTSGSPPPVTDCCP